MTSLGKPITQRQLRVGEMIKQALGLLFIRDEAKLPNLSTKEITVTEVRMSQDLKTAKIFVMPLGGKDADGVVEKLKECYDPEISVDIYNLGLIYDVKVTEDGWVHVLMSLTSAFCPAADMIPRDVQQKIESIPNLKCKVKITMQPQWGREMINPEIRELMGL